MDAYQSNGKNVSVLVVLNLIQDLEVIKPLIQALIDDTRVDLKVILPSWLLHNSARVRDYLEGAGQRYSIFSRLGILAGSNTRLLDNVDFVLLPSESSLLPHIISHRIAKVANKRGIEAITFQHGIENIGLTYFDGKAVHISSDYIITWNELVQKDPRIDIEIQRKCVPLGMFKETSTAIKPEELKSTLGFAKILGVFENLHWNRYSRSYKKMFLDCLVHAASRKKDVCFLIKPHHVGRWLNLNSRQLLQEIENIKIIDVRDSYWEQYAGNQLVGACDVIITTPSTISIDAALVSTPVAIAANDLSDLQYYEPLRLLRNSADWINYIDSVFSNPEPEKTLIERFRMKTVKKLNPIDVFKEEILKLI